MIYNLIGIPYKFNRFSFNSSIRCGLCEFYQHTEI